MSRSGRIYLDVPYRGKDEAKALGARWDPDRRLWWALTDADEACFRRWGERQPREFPGGSLGVRLLQVGEDCWSCGDQSLPIAGALIPGEWEAYPDGWVEFTDIAEAIAATHPAELLGPHAAGPVEWRRTRPVPEGYWANTCPYCAATFATPPLLERVEDSLAEGYEHKDLPGWVSELPIDTFVSDGWYRLTAIEGVSTEIIRHAEAVLASSAKTLEESRAERRLRWPWRPRQRS